MRQKTLIDLTLGGLVVVSIAIGFALYSEMAGATKPTDDQEQEQDQRQYQDQEQDQSQDQSQTTNQDQSNSQAIEFNGPSQVKTTGRSFISSGDATADCQKFGGISSGWLGGALGLGVNWTDKECRQLQIYDRLVDRGLISVANMTLCGTKTLRKLYGKDGAGQCQSELATAYTSFQGAQGDVQAQVDELRQLVRDLSSQASQDDPGGGKGYTAYDDDQGGTVVLERVQDGDSCEPCPDCEAEATRAFKACVSK